MLNGMTLINLRYIKSSFNWESSFSNFLSNIVLFRSLQVVQDIKSNSSSSSTLSSAVHIWNCPHLRHLSFPIFSILELPPSSPQEDCIILENVQTISGVVNLRLDGAMCKRIPNVKRLHLIIYDKSPPCEFMIHNLSQLQMLESFIYLRNCGDGVEKSAKKIVNQQRSLGNHSLLLARYTQ